MERVANYLDPSTEAKLTRVAEQELIQNQVSPIHGSSWHDCMVARCNAGMHATYASVYVACGRRNLGAAIVHGSGGSKQESQQSSAKSAADYEYPPNMAHVAQMTALVEMENSGLVPLLVGDQYEDLARMYALFRRVDGGLDLLRSVMGAHLKKEGSQLVQVRAPASQV